MASLSLPRVLQLKKNSIDAERDHFEKYQTLAIQKAVNGNETPVKEKHVRSTIIGTFQDQSAATYWMVAIRQPMQDNRIVAWKFCHVTHKLLREGHPACLDDSQRHIGMIDNLGKLWVHLREGYGKLVHLYCKLLVCKINFHARNPRFPGNMLLTSEELDAIAENDVNIYFQVCVELFDYMDDILNLQAAVFDSLGNARANSMTASGQCRLAALIPCAQDASQIYDCNVRILFRLHASLPPDTLAGHRERFRQQFKKLSSFYKHASSLQYYRNLLTLPMLPSNPPNFLQQSDFGTYVTPVVSIPEPQLDEPDHVAALVDTSDLLSQASTPEQPEPAEAPPDPVLERDRLIDHLQGELKRMRMETSQMMDERNTMLVSIREHCTRLETQLEYTKSALNEERERAIVLSAQTPQITQKLTEVEEKAKIQDEKFQKLKGAYTQLREEHIALIRQKAEVDKMAAKTRAIAAEHESSKMALQQQLNDKVKDVELLQQSASSSEEIEAYKNELTNLRSELDLSRQKENQLETLKASMETLEIEHKTAATESQVRLDVVTNELKELSETIERVKQEKEERESELARVKEELVGLREASGEEYKKVVEEKDSALQQVADLTEQFNREKQEQETYICSLNADIGKFIEKFEATIEEKDLEIQDREDELADLVNSSANDNMEFGEKIKQQEQEIVLLKERVQILSDSKEQVLSNLKNIMTDKDDKVINLNVEVEKLKDFVVRLQDELSEKSAELEIANNELMTMTTEHDIIMNRNDDNINLKNKELTDLTEEVQKLTEENKTMLSEIEELNNKSINEKEEHDLIIIEVKGELELLKLEYDNYKAEKEDELSKCNDNIKILNSEIEQIKSDNLSEINKISTALQEKEASLNEKIAERVLITSESQKYIEDLKAEFNEKENSSKIQIDELQQKIAEKEEENKEREDTLKEVNSELQQIKHEYDIYKIEKEKENIKLTEHLSKLTNENDQVKVDNESVINKINAEIQEKEVGFREQIAEKMFTVTETLKKLEDLKVEFNEKENASKEQIEVLQRNIMDKDRQIKEQDKLNKIVNDDLGELRNKYSNYKREKEEEVTKFNEKIVSLTSEVEQIKIERASEICKLNTELNEKESSFKEKIAKKIFLISQVEKMNEDLKAELNKRDHFNKEQIEKLEQNIIEKDQQNKLLEGRFERSESDRLSAESELQDLLQNNTSLEASVVALKKQLQQAQEELEKQRTNGLLNAGDAALEVTDAALASLERASPKDTGRFAAEVAAKALEELITKSQVQGNEEALSKFAVLAAHNTAQLTSYVTEVSNASTNVELGDKLTSECRAMLNTTRQCLEALKSGAVGAAQAGGARDRVQSVLKAAVAADSSSSAQRNVDDELADMDLAIEEAAGRIEEMLAASRAGDSGVKLEVNGKILDACTTLMGAVKLLVQDARKLQNELGDPSTRLKMYRRNPQWSEGLISAAKAVVFAAKLLVSSADEAVSAAGAARAEGVSAAAHEVAGSTAQLVAASRARAAPASPALAALTRASRSVAAATGALVAAVRAASALHHDREALDTSSLTLTATRRLEMESKVRSLELESALEAERTRLAALRKRHYQLAQLEENGNMTNGK